MIDFLDATDELLRQGAAQLSPKFREAQIDFVLTQQADDGGFVGSAGPADLYYTDFAVRCLILLDGPKQPLRTSESSTVGNGAMITSFSSPLGEVGRGLDSARDREVAPMGPIGTVDDAPVLSHAAGWVERQTPADLIHCFCALNTRRLLRTRGIALRELTGPSSATPGDHAYGLFLGLLIRQLRQESPGEGVAAALRPLRRGDGGFAESVRGKHGHTNATAAALASLWITGEADAEALGSALDFLAARQTADGGFCAHAGIRSADLLSTFTALLSLAILGRTDVDLAGVARFLRQVARPGGGFAATTDAAAPVDVEYTWYGVGLACLLRQLSALNS